MDGKAKKRVTMKLKHPNPLFEQWLTEWMDKAAQSESKMQHCFSKALQSLKKYPLPLETGRDCKILRGFGDKLCQMLDEKLQRHKNDPELEIIDAPETKKVRTSKNEYCPLYRSGGYAILVALYQKSSEADFKGYMSKEELVNAGRHLSDASFVKPNPGTYYTAWSSMRTLLDKNLVVKKGTPAKFSLTGDGLIVGRRLHRTYLEAQSEDKEAADKIEERMTQDNAEGSANQINQPNFKPPTCLGSVEEFVDLTESKENALFAPFSFDVVLLVDTAETSGTKQAKQDPILLELTHLDARFEVRHLKVGDYVWICRDRAAGEELVLPYVVERKRMDDFGSSIKDGRYHEQKFRLRQCGVRNVVYLIESYGDNSHAGLPVATLNQAAVNTMVHDGFQVKWSDGLRGTAEYLSAMTKILECKFKSKTLMSCPKLDLNESSCDDDLVPLLTFKEFILSGSKHKNFTVRDMFVKHLIQLKGLSVDKAFGIVEKYPTPKSLKMAYDACTESEGEKLLAAVPFGRNNKKIGPVISKVLYQLYTSDKFK